MKLEPKAAELLGGGFALSAAGLSGLGAVHWNLAVPALYEQVLQRGEARLSAGGALVARTGARTGRSPLDRFIVQDAATTDDIWWGEVNRPIAKDVFDGLQMRVASYLRGRDVFVQDLFAGADPNYRLPVRVITEHAWHSLFARNMFIRPTREERRGFAPRFTVIHAPDFKADPERDGTHSEAFILLDFARRLVLIGGTSYAGEIKKSIFTVMNFLLPPRGVLPMHCSANIGPRGDTAIFFGLSGTGKTTLSAERGRTLIGDDEHGWSSHSVFNFEGGCYAKVIRLDPAAEPEIYATTGRFGTILENVVMNEARALDLDDDSHTENTRASYPIDFIPNASATRHRRPARQRHHADGRRLRRAAAAEPAHAGAGHVPLPLRLHRARGGHRGRACASRRPPSPPASARRSCRAIPPSTRACCATASPRAACCCWLVNTGWSGGAYGTGERISIAHTRALVHAALDGALKRAPMRPDPAFGLLVPEACPGVPREVLQPRNAWRDKRAYDETAAEVARRFEANFAQFAGTVDEGVRAAGIHAAA